MATITSLVDKAITIKEKQVVVAKEIVSRASINKGTIFTIGNYKITVRDYWFDLKYRSVALRLTVYRDGQEVKIINPVHFRGMPYTVQKGTKIVGYYAAEDIYVRIGKVKVGDPIYAPIHQENPLEALKQAVIRYLDGQPLGKTIDSNTTLVVYGSLGGSAGRYSAPGESWSTIRDSAGTFVDSESDIYTYIESTTTTNTWSQVAQILTKDVTYCVSTTSSIAIEGPYCVSVGISTTKDVTYEVSQYAFYTLNKDVRYCVTATGSTTVNTEYTVSTVSTISKDTTYSVFSGTYHTVTKDTTYCVPATSSISKDIIYTLSTTSTVTKDSQYEIGTSSIHTITKDSQYMVRYKEYRSRIVKTRAGYGSVSHTFQSYFKYLVG